MYLCFIIILITSISIIIIIICIFIAIRIEQFSLIEFALYTYICILHTIRRYDFRYKQQTSKNNDIWTNADPIKTTDKFSQKMIKKKCKKK